jgi:hypothetical protein
MKRIIRIYSETVPFILYYWADYICKDEMAKYSLGNLYRRDHSEYLDHTTKKRVDS